MHRSVLILTLLLFLVNGAVYSQDCAVKLRDAENLFNAGRVEEVPGLLRECLASGFTKAEEMTAYQLIIRSYLFDDETEQAENTMLEFLKKNPEYEISPTDNADFVYLFNKFRVRPLIQLGISGGGVATIISGVETNSVAGTPVEGDYSNDKLSFTAGIEAIIRLSDKFELGAGVDYTELSFSYSELYLNFALNSYTEKQRHIEIPLQLYYIPRTFGIVFPYVKGGLGMALNMSTTSEVAQVNLDANNPIPHPASQVNRTDGRQSLDQFISAGLGCRIKLPRSYAFADISTRIGTRVQSKAGIPSDLEYFYGYTDDLFSLSSIRFSVGYIFIIYKPSKREE